MVRVIGLLALGTLAIGVWLATLFPPQTEGRSRQGWHSPALALEMAESAEDVAQAVGETGDPRRLRAAKSLEGDALFVAAYGLLFVALGMALAVRRGAGGGFALLGLTLALTGAGAAACDGLENVRLAGVLAVPLAELEPAAILAVRAAAELKWGLVFAALALLAPVFAAGRARLGNLLAALLGATSGLGFLGLALYPPLLEWAGAGLALGLLGAGSLLLGRGWEALPAERSGRLTLPR